MRTPAGRASAERSKLKQRRGPRPIIPKDICRHCPAPSHIRQGGQALCVRHYRYQQMRMRALTRGVYSPTVAQLEALAPNDMKCPVCRVDMNWLRADGTRTQVSLQHDRSGEIRLICMSCNCRHAALPGDSYYDIGPDHRPCPRCKQLLPRSSFGVDRRKGKVKQRAYCGPCYTAYHTAHQRERRQLKSMERAA